MVNQLQQSTWHKYLLLGHLKMVSLHKLDAFYLSGDILLIADHRQEFC